jgi:hypothetical protein
MPRVYYTGHGEREDADGTGANATVMRRAAECQLRIAARIAKDAKLAPEVGARLRLRLAAAEGHLASGRPKAAILEAREIARSVGRPLRQKPANPARGRVVPKSSAGAADNHRRQRLAAAEALLARRRRLAAAEAKAAR